MSAIERLAPALREITEAPQDPPSPGTTDRLVRGGSFVLDAPDVPPALWGEGSEILHAQGEGLLIVGGTGVGKTTLAQQYLLCRAGVLDGPLLDLPVVADPRPVLYIAADRPAQAQRSMARMVTDDHRAVLDERLIAWRGPLPFNVIAEPHALAEWVGEHGAGTVCVDFLKDIAVGLTEDAVGAALNIAIQHVLAAGIEFVALHHQRKASQQQPRQPRTIEDVYGSSWITNGMGSVVMLAGDPGSSEVSLRHIKQPMEVVGPLELLHDHSTGTTTTTTRAEKKGPWRPTHFMESVSKAVEDDPGINVRDLRASFGGKSAKKDHALRLLIAEQYVVQYKDGPALRHRSLRPYRVADEVSAATPHQESLIARLQEVA